MWMVSNIATTGTKCLWFTHHPSIHPSIHPWCMMHDALEVAGTYIILQAGTVLTTGIGFGGEGFYPLPNLYITWGILNVMPMCQWREDKSLGSTPLMTRVN